MGIALLVSVVLSGCVTGSEHFASNAGANEQGEAYSHFLTGVVLEKDGKTEEALKHYQKAADLLPESYELNRRLLDVYIDTNDLANAEKTCQRLLKTEGENVRLWIILGLTLQEQGKHEAASEAFETALALNPQQQRDYDLLVEAGERSKDWVTTIQVFEKLVELAPDKAEWHAGLGLHLSRINDGEGARKAFERALELKPDLTEARLQLGLAYLQLNENALAVDMLRSHLAAVPENGRSREILAGALARTGQYAASADELAQLGEALTRDAAVSLEYVYALLRAGRNAEAAAVEPPQGTPILSTLFKAIARKAAGEPYRPLLDTLDSVDGDIDMELADVFGTLLFFFGDKDAGEFFIQRLGELRAEGVQSNRVDIVLARTFTALKRFAEAEPLLAAVATAKPDERYAHIQLSSIYDELDRFRDAEKHLRKCLELNPEDSEAMNNLAYLYAEKDTRLDEAEALLKRALELEPNNGYYLDSLGWVYFRRGDEEKAIEYIRRAIVAMDHDDAILRDHLGDAYLEKGDVKRAVAEWRRALRLDPKIEGVKEKIEKYEKKAEKAA